MTQIKTKIPAELEPAAVGGMVTDSKYVKDRVKNKTQEEVNADTEERVSTLEESVGTGGSVDERIATAKSEVIGDAGTDYDTLGKLEDKLQEEVANRASQNYTKSETYSKTELNNMITTPNQEYVSVTATDQTTAATDVLPATGEADTVYRVGSWNGTQYEEGVYSEYSWNGSAYIKLSTKSQIGEVYDISANHADTKYADLAAALGPNGVNVPVGVRRGGMSVKFVQSSDNKYAQYFCKSNSFTTNIDDWEKINLEREVGNINTKINGFAHPVFVNNKLIEKNGYWYEFSGGYKAYVFDVRAVKGQTIIFNDIKRANSYHFAFVTDYKTIPSSQDTDLWNSLLVEGVKASTTGDAFEYKCLVPTTANYLILSGTDANPATLVQLSSINDRIDRLDKKSEKIDVNELGISKLKGGNLLLSPIEEITELLDNGGVTGYNKGWLFNYGSGYKTSIFDVSHFEENTKIDVTSVRYGSGYIWVFCKDYKTLPVQSEFENNNSLWTNNLVLAQTGRGGTTGQVYNGTIFKPSGAKYLLLVSNSTTQATAIISEDDGVLNIKGGAIPSITFSNTGHYIDLNGSVGSSSNWEQSNIFELKKGQKLIFSARVTSTLGVLLALTDANGSYYKPIITGGNSIKEYSYLAEEDCYVILQYYRIDGAPTVINDSTRLTSIEKEISDIKDVDNITPEYIAKETQRVYDELLSKLNEDILIVAFNTDQHISPNVTVDKDDNPKYTLHGIKSIANIAKKLPLDFVVLGGDAAGYDDVVSNTVEGILSETNMINEPLTEINTPVISLPGNHDAYQNNGNITSYGMYNVNFKRSKFVKELVHSGVDNCDSYWDDKDNKVRYIFLDTWSTNVRTESYSDFLSNALSTMEVGYKALVFSHNPLTNEFDGIIKKYRSPSDETGTDAFANPSDLHTILNQYADSIIACICGHSHADVYGVSSAGILYIETTSATHSRMIFRDNGLVVPYDGVLNTAKETSYDYFVVNLTEQTIEAIRFGQGSNRKWYYKGANIGLINYTNYVYGKTSIGNVTLTFTNNADSSDVVTVTSDSNGDYGVYLKLGATYTISSIGYTLDTTEITVNENTELNIEFL